MALATNLGFPRIGSKRELKKATEKYWKGDITLNELLEAGKELRVRHWHLQKDAGLDHIPCNDFSFYDQILDMTALLGAVPTRYEWSGDKVDHDTYFAMARGSQKDGRDVTAMEMTKWFDTNYHYIVPEFEEGMEFKLSSTKLFDEVEEAKAAGVAPRPVIVGPVTYIALGKEKYEGYNPKDILDKILPLYTKILQKLEEQGVEWVQIDEPFLSMDLCDGMKNTYASTYQTLKMGSNVKILLTTYFEGLRENMDLACSIPVDGLHIDGVRAADEIMTVAKKWPENKILSLGVVNGRNIWRTDLSNALDVLDAVAAKRGKDNLWVAPSCSMIHSPIDLDQEAKLDEELKGWMAFATQKLTELVTLTKGLNEGRDAIANQLAQSDQVVQSRKTSARIHNPNVQSRVKSVTPEMYDRKSPFNTRKTIQSDRLGLPSFPTTTIGSFPQTKDIRKARADYKAGRIDEATYKDAMEAEIREVVKYQEETDLDVLVHGEPERNDMVEYFGEQLSGFCFTKLGWVQSYGSRYVKPPIIFGDVERPNAMTVEWAKYAQAQTDRIMKGMLTGPVTILCWSFVRDDQARAETAKQIALAIRDEVVDLEAADIKIIQIDEAAIREGMPLRHEDRGAYLKWAVDAFRLTASGVKDDTQIHTHMCYSEFNDMISSIGDMDADVISIETSRSQMELLDAFAEYKYPNEIGPGVYDIHSPRIPTKDEMMALLEKAAKVIDLDQIWVNPDCGLKTRGWAEVKPALENMVAAAKDLRTQYKGKVAAA